MCDSNHAPDAFRAGGDAEWRAEAMSYGPTDADTQEIDPDAVEAAYRRACEEAAARRSAEASRAGECDRTTMGEPFPW